MSLNLPKSTDINRFVAKTNFYKQAGITPKLRGLIEQQIDRITWTSKVAPSTMNISSGNIEEFQSFTIQLKSYVLDNSVLVFMQKSVPYPIIFMLRSSMGSKISAVLSGTTRPVIISSDWRPTVALEPKGNSTDILYQNYLFQISDTYARTGGDIHTYLEISKLERTIDALKTKSKNETQINNRQDIARERYELEQRLKELLR